MGCKGWLAGGLVLALAVIGGPACSNESTGTGADAGGPPEAGSGQCTMDAGCDGGGCTAGACDAGGDAGSVDAGVDGGVRDAAPDATAGDAGSTCTSASDCDDGKECTKDTCTATGCTHVPYADMTPCQGGAGACCSGECVADGCGGCGDGVVEPGEECDDGNTVNCDGCSARCTVEPSCDDGDPCTTDTCDPGTGTCTHTTNNAQCDDGNPCTWDLCTATGCMHADVADYTACNGGSGVCLSGTCASVDGDGIVEPGEQCDDGNTANCDGCSAIFTIEPLCDDGDPCTTDMCDPVTGACTYVPRDGGCSATGDAGVVDGGAGSCKTAADCDDGNECTQDWCTPTGCAHAPFSGFPSCNGGAGCCVGATCAACDCGDGVVEPGEQCDDGNALYCDGCTPGCRLEPPCDDGNACTMDSCDPATGACTHTPKDGGC